MYQPDQHLRPPHPRRPPAHQSVSLYHSPDSSQTPSSRHSSPSSLKPLVGKDSSGESSNADKWFDKSNNHVTARADSKCQHWSSIVDLPVRHLSTFFLPSSDDPPFFLQQSSSEDQTPPQRQALAHGHSYLDNSASLQPGLDRLDTGSSNDDFRGVIDDLTIQNKKLKRRLRRYEKLHDAHLKDEKLFEVRVHGLPAAKKQELEDMLRTFALALNEQPGQPSTSMSKLYDRIVPGLRPQESHETMASDSAYVSASTSGQGSSAPYISASGSGQGSLALSGSSSSGKIKPRFKPTAKTRQKDIQTYLHDIPQGLLPKEPIVLSEKSKKKLIVRRLEQIFSGKGAVKGEHHHQLQQQEVSQLAAQAERSASEALGRSIAIEGSRESRIMKPLSKGDGNGSGSAEASPQHNMAEAISQLETSQQISQRDFAERSPLDSMSHQRPTRPLDLDPQRAQVPADNLLYIRHLGFSPVLEKSPQEDHGWIYLNLLINMAQLHTINVTPDQVKQALQDYSSRFELSEDGRKVRWRRDMKRAHHFDEDDDALLANFDERNPRKRIKSSHNANDISSDENAQSNQSPARQKHHQLSYTPLFFHRSSDNSDYSSSDDDDDSMETPYQALMGEGISSGLTSSGGPQTNAGVSKGPTKTSRKRGNGPIIFYNNAKFCADLSGYHKTEEMMTYNSTLYHVMTTQPIGVSGQTPSDSHSSESKCSLGDAHELPELLLSEDNSDLKFPTQTPISSASERTPLDMEVSGVGGVYPSDNFAISVKTQQSKTDTLFPGATHQTVHARCTGRLSTILQAARENRKGRPAISNEVLSTRRRDLASSKLPPASWFATCGDSDSESELEDESVTCTESDSSDPPAQTNAIQLPRMQLLGSDESEHGNETNDDDDDDGASDGSLDFLATAREIDPETIRAQEREYDANMAERLAEEIPAGSSAATAGGGSGFASPADGANPAMVAEARRAHRDKLAKLRIAASEL